MPFALSLFAALVCGFIALAYEILWYRAFAFTSGGSAATFPLLLSAYLAGMAEGALLARIICERSGRGPRTLRATAAFAIGVNVFSFLVIPVLMRVVGFAAWGWALPVVALSAAALGAILPLVCHLAISPDGRAGSRLSYVYAANVFGSVAGSLVTGYVLLRFWDTPTIARVLMIAGIALAGLLALSSTRGKERLIWVAGVAAVLAVCGGASHRLYARLYERLLYKDLYSGTRFEHLIENPLGVVAVTSDHRVFGGGLYDGVARVDIDDDQNTLIGAFIIPALHASPRRVLMLGLGAGTWTQVIAGLTMVDDITVVESNPAYLELLQDHPDVASLLHNSKVHIVVDDGRRWLERKTSGPFDVIVANTRASWRSNASALLSADFMRLVRGRLAPGGLFYFNTAGAQGAFAGAFATFPHGARFLNFAAVSDKPVAFDAARWQKALIAYRFDGRSPFDPATALGTKRLRAFLTAPYDAKGWFGAPALESRTSMLARLKGTVPVTDDNMGTEWRAIYPSLYLR